MQGPVAPLLLVVYWRAYLKHHYLLISSPHIFDRLYSFLRISSKEIQSPRCVKNKLQFGMSVGTMLRDMYLKLLTHGEPTSFACSCYID